MSRPATWRRSITLYIALAVVAISCAGPPETVSSSSTPLTDQPVPPLDDETVQRGSDLYQAYCAACHGEDLSGQDDWRTSREDGSYPAPPHDSSGHTWHHPDSLLLEIIRDGVDLPQSRMPTFGDRLSDEEILAIIEFLKSNWGEQERSFQWEVTQRENGAGG